MDFFTEVLAIKRRMRKGEGLTLMTTASTIGPKISPMFTPESMAIQGYSYGYTKGTVQWMMAGGRRRDKGEEGERLGKGAPFVKVGRLICAIQEPGTQVTETVVKVH